VLLAPITATVIAAFIVEGKTDPCFEAFRAHRFW
jgi:hypothetical protein